MREKKFQASFNSAHYTHAAGLGKNKAGTSGSEFMCSFSVQFNPIVILIIKLSYSSGIKSNDFTPSVIIQKENNIFCHIHKENIRIPNGTAPNLGFSGKSSWTAALSNWGIRRSFRLHNKENCCISYSSSTGHGQVFT